MARGRRGRKPGTVAEELFYLLVMGITGEGDELYYNETGALCLQAAERLHGLVGTRKLTRTQALAVIDTAVALASAGGV